MNLTDRAVDLFAVQFTNEMNGTELSEHSRVERELLMTCAKLAFLKALMFYIKKYEDFREKEAKS